LTERRAEASLDGIEGTQEKCADLQFPRFKALTSDFVGRSDLLDAEEVRGSNPLAPTEKVPPPPIPHLTLVGTRVTNNSLPASQSIAVHGGGLFTTFAVALTNSTITGNSPDTCFGTTC
jgi:hypothetical protein